MSKRLTRPRGDRWVAGVLGGLAAYLGTDPTIVRLLAIIVMLITGLFPFVLIYLIAWIAIPESNY